MKEWEKGKEPVEKPFMMSQVMDGLREYYDLSHDERTADLILGMTDFILRESYCGPGGFTYIVKLSDDEAQKEFREKEIENYQRKPGAFRAYLNAEHLAFAYLQTGNERYKKVLLQLAPGASTAGQKEKGQVSRALADIEQPREDTQPPAAVTDLKAERLSDGRIRLIWTTPADAARLQIKWAPRPIVEDCNPDKRETHANWWAGIDIADEPAPEPGKQQSLEVKVAPAKTHYFAIRTYDKSSNRSALSNIADVGE
jgi:hypothetical protein